MDYRLENQADIATSRHWDGLQFTWRRHLSPREIRYCRIRIHDLPGELLDAEAREEVPLGSKLTYLIQRCNAFLFFFNPTAKEDRVHLEDHFQIELERLEQLLEMLRSGRAGFWQFTRRRFGIRPLVIVITCRDKWGQNEELRRRVQQWKEEALQKLREVWQGAPSEILKHTTVQELANPPPSAANVRAPVPNEQGRQLQSIIELLLRQQRTWTRAHLSLLAIFLAFIMLVSFVVFFTRALAAPDPRVQELTKEMQYWAHSENWKTLKTTERLEHVHGLLRRGCSMLQSTALNEMQVKHREVIQRCLLNISNFIDAEMDVPIKSGEELRAKMQRWNLLLRELRPPERVGKLRACQYKFWDVVERGITLLLDNCADADQAIEQLTRFQNEIQRYQVPPQPEYLFAEITQTINFLKLPEYSLTLDATLEYSGLDSRRKRLGHVLVFLHDRAQDKYWLEPEAKSSVPTGRFVRVWQDEKESPSKFRPIEVKLRRASKAQYNKQERDIDVYYYHYEKAGPDKWEHVNPDWRGSHWGPLAQFGFPYFGPPDTRYQLKSAYYVLELKVLETQPPWENAPRLLRRWAIESTSKRQGSK